MINNLYDFFSNLTIKQIAIVCFLILPYSIFIFWFIFHEIYNVISRLAYKIQSNEKNIKIFLKAAKTKIAYCYRFVYFGLLIPLAFLLYFDLLHFNVCKFKIIIIVFLLGIPYILTLLNDTRIIYFNIVEWGTRITNIFSDNIKRTNRKYLTYLMAVLLSPIIGFMFSIILIIYVPAQFFEAYRCLIKDIYHAIKSNKSKNSKKARSKIILYKYMSAEGWFKTNRDTYLDGKLYFSNRKDLNDPLENISIAERTSSMSKDDNYDPLEKYKICSMTSNPNNFAMWTHYANEHRGVCIEYEIDTNILSQQNIKLEKVIYTSRLPIIRDFVYPYDFEKNELKWADVRKLLFYKLKNWKYEEEWRLVKESTTPELFNIGKATRILCGYKTKDEYIAKLKNSVCVNVEKVTLERTERDGVYLYVSGYTDDSFGEHTNEDWKYNIGSEGVTIISYKGAKKDVQIPANIRGKSVIEIGENSFKDNDKISSVSIPDTVLKINRCAFSGCYLLSNVSFGENIKNIEKEAFAYCNSIILIELPKSVNKIGNGAFRSCSELKEIKIPSSIKREGFNVFRDCSYQLNVIYY